MAKASWQSWKRRIDQAIADVAVRVILEPLTCFSEADLQQQLTEELGSIEELYAPRPTSISKGKGARSCYRTPIVHREYGGGGRTRLDIVVLDPEDVAQIDDVQLRSGGKYLRPVYAMELGTEKTTDTKTHLANDLAKLDSRLKSGGTGYVIYVYRDTTQAPTDSGRRAKTGDKITREFRNACRAVRQAAPPNIKVLALLIRVGRDQARMVGKCEILDGKRWQKVNLSHTLDLRAAVLRQLA